MNAAVRRIAVAVTLVSAGTLLLRADDARQSGAADVQYQLGSLLAAEGRYAEAYDAFAQAVSAEDPGLRLRARKSLVQSALRSAQFNEAAGEAAALLRTDPDDPDLLALHGDAMWALGLFEESESSFREALALAPTLARGHHGVARSLLGRNKPDVALGEALVAVAGAPGDPEIHLTLGQIYERLRRFEDASFEYNNVLRLLPQKDQTPQAVLLRGLAAYLRTFANKTPYERQHPQGITLHTLPFKEVRGKIMLRARVNGGDWVDLVVDTGAERTSITRRTAQRNGVLPLITTVGAGVGDIGLRGLEVGTIDRLEIGSLTIRNVPCLIKNPPLVGMPDREAEAFSPLALGLSVRIDYQQRRLTMGDILPELPADVELPMYVSRLATVRGLVDNTRPTNFVVDTGGEVLSISAAMARSLNKPEGVRRIPLKVYGTSGWDRSAFLLPGVDLAFKDIRFQNRSVVVLDLDAPSLLLGYQLGGIIGHGFLSKYRVDLDLVRSVMRLKGI